MGHVGSRICVKEEMAPNGQAFEQNKKEGFASPDIEASDQAWTTAGAGSGQWNVSPEQDPEQGDTHMGNGPRWCSLLVEKKQAVYKTEEGQSATHWD